MLAVATENTQGIADIDRQLRVLMVTTEWPSPDRPEAVPFLVRQAEFLRRAGIAVEVFPFRGGGKLRNYWKAWRQLRRRLRDAAYDLVHAQFGQSGLLSWPKSLPWVVTFRGDDLQGVPGKDGRPTFAGAVLQRVCRLVAIRADAVILVAEHMRRYVPPRVPVHVIPSGLDLDSIPCYSQEEARRRLGLPRTGYLILFVGNPAEPGKRYGLAMQAVEILNKTVPAKCITGWGLRHADVLMMMNACNVLVFTSQQEGSPNVVKEALACNLPVVSVAVGDVPQRLRGIEGCELCADHRPETVAAALERVLRQCRRINGREAVRNLDEALLTQQLIGVYQSILTSKRYQRRRSAIV